MEKTRHGILENANGVLSFSPGLGRRRYPGSVISRFPTLKGLQPAKKTRGRNPFRVAKTATQPPRVVASRQLWATGRNAVGVQLRQSPLLGIPRRIKKAEHATVREIWNLVLKISF